MNDRRRTRLSPRKRKLRLTFGLLLLGLVCGGGVWWLLDRGGGTTPYRPGEANPDVTRRLARGLPAEAPEPRFVDVTRDAGLGSFRNFAGDRTSQIPEDMGPGLAWGDYDDDGDEDLLAVSAGGAMTGEAADWPACELYRNEGDGTFARVEAFPRLRWLGMAAAWGDYDDDGWLDLVVTGFEVLGLFHNEGGTGEFTPGPVLTDRSGYWAGAAWGDFDNDRDLDLYVCGYVAYQANTSRQGQRSRQLGTAVPYTLNPASYDPVGNLLFRNEGGGAFVEVAQSLGVANPEGRSLGALWHDFDQDGWLDLYVANDISDNAFFRNTGGRFEDISHPAWVADYRSAMGLAAGDWNRDGDDDLFITHWVAQENALYDNLLADSAAASPSAGNTPDSRGGAAASAPGIRFVDVNEMQGLGQVALPFVGWGTEFVDVDADGWLDLVVANGSTLEEEEEEKGAPKRLKAQEPFLFWNRGGNFFHDVAPICGVLAEKHVGRGLALADYDGDGDMDFAMAHLGEGLQLLRNDTPAGHWFKVRLRSWNAAGEPTGRGEGTTVILHVDGVELRRSVSGVSYLSQSSRELHWGLGDARAISVMEIRWHAGETNRFMNLPADSAWEIVEGDAGPRRLALAPSGAEADLREERSRLVEFWRLHRAAMEAMKVEQDSVRAIALFREALRMDPRHEDAHYYLAQCLAGAGDIDGALAELQTLARLDPQSHRAFQQWGRLRLLHASSAEHLVQAAARMEQARSINPEETGALLILGEIALIQEQWDQAGTWLSDACRSNPRAAGGYFLQSYVAWKRGDRERSALFLEETRRALGPEWQPRGATAEGDVKRKWHREDTPLSRFWEAWDGTMTPDSVHEPVAAFLRDRYSFASGGAD